MAKITYTFNLPKKAVIRLPQGVVELGHIANYQDINGKVSVTIMFNKKVPMELLKLLQEDPTKISIVGQPKDVSKAELTDLIESSFTLDDSK